MPSAFPHNHHSHTRFCDGAENPEDYITECLKLGYKTYGFSGHAPFPFPTEWNIKAEETDDYINEIQRLKTKYRGQINIFCAMEVDYLDQVQGPSHFSHLLDYTIGSVHFIGKGPETELFEMDGSFEKFATGVEVHYQNNLRQAVEHYFQLTTDMIQNDPPDILGHPDKIITNASGIDSELIHRNWYRDLLFHLAENLSRSNVMVEISTRGMRSKMHPSLYPHPEFLKILTQFPIKFQLNADVHRLSDIDFYYSEALEMIKSFGINELWIKTGEGWAPEKIA
jgi:histidinol-phosphatase (PHP family)